MKRINLTNIFNHPLFPFLILYLSLVLVFLHAPIPIGDDVYYRNVPNGLLDWSFYQARYQGWSSRLIIEFFVVGFLQFPKIYWVFINSTIITSFALSLSILFVKSNNSFMNWFIIFLFYFFPYREILADGWVTVSLNYLWPISLGIISMIVIKKIVLNEYISTYEYLFSTFALIFAVNHEIMCILMLLILFSITIFLHFRKRCNWYVYSNLAFCVASLIFIVTTPGNFVRKSAEVKWFNNFEFLSVIEKLEIGLSSTFAKYLFNFNFLFFIFSILLMTLIWKEYSDRLFKVISIIPLTFMILFGNVIINFNQVFPNLVLIKSQMTKYGIITLVNFTQIRSYVPYFLLYITSSIVVLLLYLIFGNSWSSLIAISTYLLGLFSRVIIAFTPTIWASGERTYTFLFSSFIICNIMIFHQLSNSKHKKIAINFLIICGVVASMTYLNLFLSL